MAFEIDPTFLADALAASDRVVVVDFHDDGCAPCLTQERFTGVLEIDLRDTAEVYRLNLSRAPDIAERFGIDGVPAVAVFKGGRRRHLFPGLTDPGALAAAAVALSRET